MRFPLVLIPFLLASCAGQNQLSRPDGVALEDVVQRIKTEVGLFEREEQLHINDPPLNNACHGYVNLHITKVQMTLSAALVTTTTGSVKVGIPLATPAKLGLSAGATRTVKNSETLVFTAYTNGPLNDPGFDKFAASLTTDTPISKTLIQLRKALLVQSDHGPCFALRQGDADPGNTISFTIDIDNKGTGGVDFSYALFSASASQSGDNDYTNKIEISFSPYLDAVSAKGAIDGKRAAPAVPAPSSGAKSPCPQGLPHNPHGRRGGFLKPKDCS